MNFQSMFALGVAAVCVAPLQAAELTGPSLKQGAVISISNGQLSRKDAKTYIRKYKNSPEPRSITIVVREVVLVDNIECYLDSSGLRNATVEGFAQAPLVMYVTKGELAELVVNAASPVNSSGASYYLRSRDQHKAEFLERGGGAGAVIKFFSREGNMWMGVINGAFYSPQEKLSYRLKDAPICIEIPQEGSTIDDLVAASTTLSGAEPEPEIAPEPPQAPAPQADMTVDVQPADVAFALTSETAQELIRKRLQMMVGKPVDEPLMQAFYAEKVTRLTDGKEVKSADIIAATRRMVETWPRRGVSLLGAGINGQQLELLLVFSFNDGKGNENAQYGKITLRVDASGRVDGMSEEYTPRKPQPTKGYTTIKYLGEKDVITIE